MPRATSATGARADWSLSGNYNKTKVTKIAPAAQAARRARRCSTRPPSRTWRPPRPSSGRAGVLYSVRSAELQPAESYHGKSSDRETYDGSVYLTNRIKSALLTDLEANWKFYKGFTFIVGANNLFNRYPNRVNGDLEEGAVREQRQQLRHSLPVVLALRDQRRLLLQQGERGFLIEARLSFPHRGGRRRWCPSLPADRRALHGVQPADAALGQGEQAGELGRG